MKNWQLVLVLIVVIATGATTALYVKYKSITVMAELKTTVDQQSEELRKAFSASVSTAESNTTEAVNAGLNELSTSMAGKIESASSRSSTELTRRLDSLESSVNAKIAAIGLPAHSQARPSVEVPEADLTGQWEATLPSGATLRSPIVRLDDGRYNLTKLGVFSGIYELRSDRLVVVEPVDKRLTEFVWQVQDTNSLILIKSSTKTGADYTGATLKRIQ